MSAEEQSCFYNEMVNYLLDRLDQQPGDGTNASSIAIGYAVFRVATAITKAEEEAGPIPDRDELAEACVRLAAADDLHDLRCMIEDAALYMDGPYDDPSAERVINYARTLQNDASLRTRLEQRLGRDLVGASMFVLKQFVRRAQHSVPPNGQESATETP